MLAFIARSSRSGTGILFGLIPALQGSRAPISAHAQGERRPFGHEFRQNKARAILVVAEVALALILLVGSALLIRTSLALRRGQSRVRSEQRADDANVAVRGRAS